MNTTRQSNRISNSGAITKKNGGYDMELAFNANTTHSHTQKKWTYKNIYELNHTMKYLYKTFLLRKMEYEMRKTYILQSTKFTKLYTQVSYC